jgi:hypothetical protein
MAVTSYRAPASLRARNKSLQLPLTRWFRSVAVAFACAKNSDDTTEKLKATLRRLQAALAPSLFRKAPPDAIVIRELAAMLASKGVKTLLAQAPDHPLADVIRRAQAVIEEGAPDQDTINRLWQFMDDDDLNAELATDDENEQPARLVSLMLAGPYCEGPKADR